MDLCKVGSLSNLVANYLVDLNENQIAYICFSTLIALAYLEEKGVVHSDIKGGNLLLTKDGHIRVADFGVSRVYAKGGEFGGGSMTGSLLWMAPETFTGVETDFKVGFFHLSIILVLYCISLFSFFSSPLPLPLSLSLSPSSSLSLSLSICPCI